MQGEYQWFNMLSLLVFNLHKPQFAKYI